MTISAEPILAGLTSRLLLVAALAALPPAAAHAGEKLVLASGVLPPYAASPAGPGFAELVAREAFRRLGIEIEVVGLPAERALINANAGIDDGDLSRIPGLESEYPNLVRVPEKMMDFEFVGFTRNLDFRVEGWHSLRPYAVGLVTGWKIYERNTREVRERITVRDPEELFALLALGRAEVVLMERWEGLWQARSAGMAVHTLEPPFARSEMFLYLNNKHAALVPRVARALADMKADGSYQRIFDAVLKPLERR